MNEKHLEALLLLSGFTHSNKYKIQNEYCSHECCRDSPWWLVKTSQGFVKMGWRKRVISIDWSDTGKDLEITFDDVTKDKHMVHAWGYNKALEYLRTLNIMLNLQNRIAE